MTLSNKRRNSEQGYVLLTLMLFVALLSIASMAWIEKFDFQMKRDREEELIHRGVQYSRAIRRYVRKFGRYPGRLEDLENTNNVRYLRKRYKDPITGKEFKLLHQNEVQLSFSPGAPSGLPPGSADASTAQGGAPGSLNANAAVPAGAPAGPVSGGPAASQPGSSAPDTTADSSSGSDQAAASQPGSSGSSNGTAGLSSAQSGNGSQNGQTFGGLPIVGVASISKDKSIREFNKKEHYNEWQFIYDPSTDRGGLLTTPNQPSLAGAAGQQGGIMGQGAGMMNSGGMNSGGMNSGGMNSGSTGTQSNQPQQSSPHW